MIKASQWFAPKWKHQDAEVRAGAVAKAQEQALLDALPEIARSDGNASVRMAALARCGDDTELLRNCLASERNAHNRQWILARLVQQQLQQASPDAVNDTQLAALLDALAAEHDNSSWASSQIEALASKAKNMTVRQQALQRISKQGLLGDLYCKEPDPELREAMLSRIDQVSTLERISKTLRKNNKALYQACQQRLAQLGGSEQQGDASDLRAAQDLLNDIEHLLHGKQAPLQAISGQASLTTTLQQAQQRWQALAIDTGGDEGQSLHRRWHSAMQILQQAAAAKPAAAPPPAAAASDQNELPGEAEDGSDEKSAQAQLQQLATALDALLKRKPKTLKALRQQLQPWRERWRAEWQQLNNISRADQRLQDQLVNRIQQAEDRLDDRQEQRQQSHAALAQLLQQAAQLASNGKLHDANRTFAELTEALQECSAAAQKQFQQQQASSLRQVQVELGELRKWQRWSDNQQRKRLLDELRAAKDSELNADALVHLVKDARQQWQQMETSEIQAGMRPLGKTHALNRQLQGLCGMLMRQAKPFLQKRDVLRHERGKLIEERLQACEQLLARSDLNVKQLLQQKRAISQSFQEMGSVAAEQRKSLLPALRQSQQALQDRIQALSASAEQEKRRLIRLAEQLPHEADKAAALQQAKALQREWQQLDVLPRKQEQALWENFRAPMDDLFAAHDEQRQQHKAEQQAQREQQQDIVAELESLLEKPDNELADCRARCEDLQHQFSLQQRPERGLQQRMRQAVDQFEQRLQHAIQQRRQQAWQAADSKARAQQNAASQRLQALQAGADTQGAAADLPEPLQALDAAQLQQHLQQHSEAARAACIAAEFMAGLPSPAADQQQRMQYQVDRLSHHLRDKQQSSPAQQLRQVRENWYACMPMHPDDYETLQARFDRAMAAADKILSR